MAQFPETNIPQTSNPWDFSQYGMRTLQSMFAPQSMRDAEQMRQRALEEAQQRILQQKLESERYGQMTPLELQIKGTEAARAKEMGTPEMLEAYTGGYKGQMQSQQTAGEKAVREAKLLKPFYDAQSVAIDPNASPEERQAATQRLTEIAGVLGITPQNMFDLQKAQVTAQSKQLKPQVVTALMNWSLRAGVPLQEAISLYEAGKIELGDFGGQPTKQPTIGFPFGQQQPTTAPPQLKVAPEEQRQRDSERLRLLEEELARNPNDTALVNEIENELAKKNLGQVAPTTTAQPTALEKTYYPQSNAALPRERAYNIIENAGQAAQELKNIAKAPSGSVLGSLSGLSTKTGESFTEGLKSTLSRKVTNEDNRMFQQMVSGLESAMAMVLGGGYASAATKGRMKLVADQLPRSGDQAVHMAMFLARMKQEFTVAAENYGDRVGVRPEQAKRMKQYVQDIEKAIQWSVDDILDYQRNTKGKEAASELLNSIYGKPIEKTTEEPKKYSVGDKKTIGKDTYIRTEKGWEKQ